MEKTTQNFNNRRGARGRGVRLLFPFLFLTLKTTKNICVYSKSFRILFSTLTVKAEKKICIIIKIDRLGKFMQQMIVTVFSYSVWNYNAMTSLKDNLWRKMFGEIPKDFLLLSRFKDLLGHFPKFNKCGCGIRVFSWVENFLKINKRWGTSIRDLIAQ